MQNPDANRAAGMRRLVSNSVVIPGRSAAANPESITTTVSMDSQMRNCAS
jgi:hypothetical protein